MAPQQKMLRVFKLIRLLKQRPGKTVDQLAQFLEKDKRSVYRYLELLQEVGYEVDSQGSPPRYYLFEDETRQQPPFTEEEAQGFSVTLGECGNNGLDCSKKGVSTHFIVLT